MEFASEDSPEKRKYWERNVWHSFGQASSKMPKQARRCPSKLEDAETIDGFEGLDKVRAGGKLNIVYELEDSSSDSELEMTTMTQETQVDTTTKMKEYVKKEVKEEVNKEVHKEVKKEVKKDMKKVAQVMLRDSDSDESCLTPIAFFSDSEDKHVPNQKQVSLGRAFGWYKHREDVENDYADISQKKHRQGWMPRWRLQGKKRRLYRH